MPAVAHDAQAATAAELTIEDWRHEHRYGIYTVRVCPQCEGRGAVAAPSQADSWPLPTRQVCPACKGTRWALVLLACADSKEAAGVALVQQGLDCIEAGTEPECYGVMDGHERRWVAHPCWAAGRWGR